MRKRKDDFWRDVWGCTVLILIFFLLVFLPQDPAADKQMEQGLNQKQRWEIVHRVPISRADYEMLKLYGWDKDSAGHRAVIINLDDKPELVEWRPKK